MRFLGLVLATVIFAGSANRNFKIVTPDGTEVLTYDPVAVSPSDLERWAQLSEEVSPYNAYMVPESLARCVSESSEYARCGTRDLGDPNFFHNARVNLARMENRIELLRSGRYPEQLQPVVAYFLRIQTTFLAINRAELQYLQDSNPNDLNHYG